MSARGAAPVVPTRRALFTVWLTAALGFVVLLSVAQRLEGPLDDPDQAEQRVGFLDQAPLPLPAPMVTAGLPAVGRPSVVLFLRPHDAAHECRDVAGRVATSSAVLVVVLAGPAACPGISAVLVDPTGRTATTYGMRVPADGGPPVGYAVVDDRARVRYRTLDPDPAAHSGEVTTMLAAL
ncbi:MAG: hypothetical protein ABIS47_01280 [Acidimicrobiales bacterium]